MASRQLVIAPAARNDLEDIYHFGLRQWGQSRSESYLAMIREHFWRLTQQPLLGTERPELLPDCRSVILERHILFYRVSANRIEILRVLHGRQDPQRNLK